MKLKMCTNCFPWKGAFAPHRKNQIWGTVDTIIQTRSTSGFDVSPSFLCTVPGARGDSCSLGILRLHLDLAGTPAPYYWGWGT